MSLTLTFPRYIAAIELVAPNFGRNHHVTMDNWFMSPKLFQDLRNRGTNATGTVVVQRKGLPQSFKTTRLRKSQQDHLAILYADRKHVIFLTTSDNGR